MAYILRVRSSDLWESGNAQVSVDAPGISNVQVCKGGNGWPTPHLIGLYIDTDNNRSCIIDWPEPCTPIKFTCEYGTFVAHLDTASEEEIASASEVEANFFRDD